MSQQELVILSLGSANAAVDIDQYSGGQGFGFVYESSTPSGAHLIGTIHTLKWLQTVKALPRVPDAEAVDQWPLLRGVLWWLDEWVNQQAVRRTVAGGEFVWMGDRESMEGLSSGPPGHKDPGTEGWVFRGVTWRLHMPLYKGEVVLSLSDAVPPEDPWDAQILLMEWGLFLRKLKTELPPYAHRS